MYCVVLCCVASLGSMYVLLSIDERFASAMLVCCGSLGACVVDVVGEWAVLDLQTQATAIDANMKFSSVSPSTGGMNASNSNAAAILLCYTCD